MHDETAGVPLSVLKELWRAQLEPMPTPVIRAEVNRRTSKEHPQPRKLEPCAGCGAMLGARERRKACPNCGARSPRKITQK